MLYQLSLINYLQALKSIQKTQLPNTDIKQERINTSGIVAIGPEVAFVCF